MHFVCCPEQDVKRHPRDVRLDNRNVFCLTDPRNKYF